MSGFEFGDWINGPSCNPRKFPAMVTYRSDVHKGYSLRYSDGSTGFVTDATILLHSIKKVPATLQVGDVVEITKPDLWDHAVNAWPRVENRWTVEEVFRGDGFRIRNAFGALSVGGFEIRKIASKPATPQCDCSARDLAWIGHTCGLANSDPWRALAGVFE